MAIPQTAAPTGARKHVGLLLIALAATMWSSDVYFRSQLVGHLTSTQIVLGEDVLASLLLAGVTIRNWRALRALSKGEWTATATIAVLAQAMGTVLFTLSFTGGLFQETYILLQTQPLIAIALAMAALGERPRAYYWPLLLVAMVGVYLVLIGPDATVPFHAITSGRFIVGIESLGAAVCWASGTVLGRFVTTSLSPATVAALRFQLAIPVLLVLTLTLPMHIGFAGSHVGLSGYRAGDFVWLLAIALVTGVISLAIYYRGLRSTPASMATIGELANPITATLITSLPVSLGGFAQPISMAQIVGTVLLLSAVVALSWASTQTVTLTRAVRENLSENAA